ncbi:heavy metal-associated isoprenylated plant protein 45 [Rhododendron vialii]|uniref:heavy metal-associated isoprenylated plant protein 45 n=1 Tax=Rhododendron vialii TaxID=182163 RepID=UPI00265DF539|nr:heavy metal-associated isoprenylated plant protein 45 [Rhododendron vialii]
MFGWCFGQTQISNALAIVELLVHMDCEGCEKRVRRAISKLDGVDSLEIDMDKQKVTVSGYVDQRKVLKVVRRTGRKAEFWPYPYDSEYYPYASQYLDESTFSATYNYYTHGYNESMHGYLPDPVYSKIVDDEMAEVFSPENVHHACSIM